MTQDTNTKAAAQDTTRAATNVSDFIGELDGGNFERLLSIALSTVAAAVMDSDKDKQGKVAVEFTVARIAGTFQAQITHKLTFSRPTADGKSAEEQTRSSVFHVGRFGKLTINQPQLLPKQGELT